MRKVCSINRLAIDYRQGSLVPEGEKTQPGEKLVEKRSCGLKW